MKQILSHNTSLAKFVCVCSVFIQNLASVDWVSAGGGGGRDIACYDRIWLPCSALQVQQSKQGPQHFACVSPAFTITTVSGWVESGLSSLSAVFTNPSCAVIPPLPRASIGWECGRPEPSIPNEKRLCAWRTPSRPPIAASAGWTCQLPRVRYKSGDQPGCSFIPSELSQLQGKGRG